ncbi:MAG: EF2563 family selenium-dependent molybdenum hydroxylase system protein [Chloroflexi bacterium]|nr:EF2563 family selenium-dependent molybdenum hydroxylase system protein [Chloroflexota bacterium]
MTFANTLCIVRGGGDLATGVVHRLRCAGLRVIVLELEQPRVVRRMASLAQAMYSGQFAVGDLVAKRMTLPEAAEATESDAIPVIADSVGASVPVLRPSIVVDARMAKAPLDTAIDAAPFVVGLGPGFTAGVHCHAVVETNRGHYLGHVIWQGSAQPNTGQPEAVMGVVGERVLRAPVSGVLQAHRQIGELVGQGEAIASVDGHTVCAPFGGALRGLLYDGLPVAAEEKIGDLDPRRRRDYCFTISDKALAVGGGVLEAVLVWLRKR